MNKNIKDSNGVEYTNHHNLPPEIVSAIIKDYYTVPGEVPSDWSCSSLVAPIQKTIIEKWFGKNSPELRIFDVMHNYWAFLGSIAHSVLENSWHKSYGGIPEERIYIEVLGKTISGKLDMYRDAVVGDYKTTKVYKIMKADYSDWEKSMNIYAEMCRQNNRAVEKLEITILLTDWKKGETYKNNYPDAPIQIIELRLWSEKEAQSYINDRVQQLIDADTILESVKASYDPERGDDIANVNEKILEIATFKLFKAFPCYPKEMWEDLKDYAVFKKEAEKGARATKSCETQKEAEEFIAMKCWHSSHEVVKRMTDRTRCIDWCNCQTKCVQYKDYIGENIDPDAPKPLF